MKTNGIEIARTDSPHGGRYEAVNRAGNIIGELTYDRAPDDTIVARHTEVDVSERGKGIARQLVEQLVADARAEDAKILPRCSYVRSRFESHPEWSDVLKRR
jgi:predicted GNAT family acetyltransferase